VVQIAADALLGPTHLAELPRSGRRPFVRRMAGARVATAPGRRGEAGRSYSARKPYVVAERLDDLRGPVAGRVTLPPHLDWSGNATYDLGKPARLASLYRTVLNEAGCVEDLRTWLNARLLTQLWPTLWLPPALRRAWESRFPELRALRARTV
jgi:hypothetical protein